jgi:hypothetical protein
LLSVEVLTSVKMSRMVFWVVTPPGIVGIQMFWRNILPPSSAIYCYHRVMIFGRDAKYIIFPKTELLPNQQNNLGFGFD